MSEHRYPRRWKYRDHYCLYAEVRRPLGPHYWVTKDKEYDHDDTEGRGDIDARNGLCVETFDHLKDVPVESAEALLKRLVEAYPRDGEPYKEAEAAARAFLRKPPAPTPDATLLAAAREAVDALKIANIHLGWGDCSLENVHNLVRKTADALAAALADHDRQPNERM